MKIFLLFNSSLFIFPPLFVGRTAANLSRYQIRSHCSPVQAMPAILGVSGAGWLVGVWPSVLTAFIYYCRIESKDWICCILAVRVCLSQIPFCLSNKFGQVCAAVFELKETSLNLGSHTPWSSAATLSYALWVTFPASTQYRHGARLQLSCMPCG